VHAQTKETTRRHELAPVGAPSPLATLVFSAPRRCRSATSSSRRASSRCSRTRPVPWHECGSSSPPCFPAPVAVASSINEVECNLMLGGNIVAVPLPLNLFKRTRRMPLSSHCPTRRRVRASPRGPFESGESLRSSGCCARGPASPAAFFMVRRTRRVESGSSESPGIRCSHDRRRRLRRDMAHSSSPESCQRSTKARRFGAASDNRS
jgi:hypothetical protein